MHEKLSSPVELIKRSVEIYFKKENFLYFLKLHLFIILITIPLMFLYALLLGVTFVDLFRTSTFGEESGLPIGLPSGNFWAFFGIMMLVGVVFGGWIFATVVHTIHQVVEGKTIGILATFKFTWAKIVKIIAASAISTIVVYIGFFLLIIPGIILLVWFMFHQYFVVLADLGPIEAIKKSKELVDGYFLAVVGRMIIIILYTMIIVLVLNIIPIVGGIAMVLIYSHFIIPHYLLFKELRAIKGV